MADTPTIQDIAVPIHEAFGLTGDIRRIASRFASAGYPTLAPDFLAGPRPETDLHRPLRPPERSVEHDVRSYPAAGHSFMSRHDGLTATIGAWSPMRTGYVEPAADDAWERTLAFFGRHLAAA